MINCSVQFYDKWLKLLQGSSQNKEFAAFFILISSSVWSIEIMVTVFIYFILFIQKM